MQHKVLTFTTGRRKTSISRIRLIEHHKKDMVSSSDVLAHASPEQNNQPNDMNTDEAKDALLKPANEEATTPHLPQKGSLHVVINDKPFEEYFPTESLQRTALLPLSIVHREYMYGVHGRVHGGGISSQAGAVSHALARALIQIDPSLRPALKKEGLLTRDSRMKERKKYGQKGARKRFQYSKR